MSLSNAQRYAGLLALLENERMISMYLSVDFRENIKRSFNINDGEMESLMVYARENVDFNSSIIYVDWK